ncbi:hypothetical protein MMC19_005406 [Ptychographa xylographoides]|nr:hypothetical protein [Ptychographa xylographoides]
MLSVSFCNLYSYLELTKLSTTRTIGGTDVNATMTVPNSPIDKLDNAAALGSDTRSNAVAIAEELHPKVTPRVT